MEDFTITTLRKLKKIRQNLFNFPKKDPYHALWKELYTILHTSNPKVWKELQLKTITGFGKVKVQKLGTFYYKHTMHKFTWLCLEPHSLIGEHSHTKYVNKNGKKGGQAKNITEILFYPNGIDSICKPGESHCIENTSNSELYILSVEISSKRDF